MKQHSFFVYYVYTQSTMGIFYAILSALFFGLYIIPRKLSKQPPLEFCTTTALAFTFGSIALYVFQIFFGPYETLLNLNLIYAIFGGIAWATAFVLLVESIDKIGLARSNQWKNLQGPIGVLLALTILGESNTVNPILAILSGLAVFSSASMFNIIDEKQEKTVNKLGVFLALCSGLLFGIGSAINKYVTDNAGVYSQLVVWSSSVLVSLIIFQLWNKKFSLQLFRINKETLLGLTSGILYLGASLFMLLSFNLLESSIAFTIIQMNFAIVILLGIFIFKEFEIKENIPRLIAGFVLATIGILLLSASK
ncbi:MAG: GRP family sugar transporter [Bdellovibrionota bacterium]